LKYAYIIAKIYINFFYILIFKRGGYMKIRTKVISSLVVAIILGILVSAEASQKYIRDDSTGGDCTSIGAWDPSTKTCTMNTDISDTIRIVSDEITLDGNGHTITGFNTGFGIILLNQNRVTIKSVSVKGFIFGVDLEYANDNTISDITVSDNYFGIYFYSSCGNTLTNNKINENSYGVTLDTSSSNTLNSNTALNNYVSYWLSYKASNNNFINNIASSNGDSGILIATSDNNIFVNNTASNNQYHGIVSNFSNGNIFVGNAVSDNTSNGIDIYSSSNNTFADNNTSNNSANGIYVAYSSDSNVFTGNTLTSNNSNGIWIIAANSNSIYNNNFNNNTVQAYAEESSGNLFSRPAPLGGNYWSDYNNSSQGCSDTNSDGFCDAPYIFAGGQDDFPWTQQNGWPDTIPPLTIINVPVMWQKADFTVLLNCIDNPHGSGCKETLYRIDGAAWQTGTSINISTEGDHLIEYYSIDNAGNQESMKSAHAKLDKTPPTTTDNAPQTWQTSAFTISLACSDNADGSGCKETMYRIDGSSWQTGSSVNIATEGDHLIEYYSVDNAGNQESIKDTHAKIDNTAPTSSISLSGLSGNAGWWRSNVTVTLTATDNSGGSGVSSIAFSLDGGNTYQPYNGPFVISQEGTTQILARATDNAGNTESSPKAVIVKIDKTTPTINISSPQEIDYLHSDNVTISFSATDNISGLVNDPTAMLDNTAVINGQSINLLSLSLGTHTLAVTASDVAGNSGTKSVSFHIIATIDSLISTVNILAQQGKITDTNVVKSLLSKLNEAKQALSRGNKKTAVSKLQDFRDQVLAQSGKKITTDAASLLITDVNFVLSKI
jgi:parallel beta-helix repeat protein